MMHWQWNEMAGVGRDYGDAEEVAVYDQSHADFRDVDAEAQKALQLLDLGPGNTILDIGCGTGTFALAAAKHGLEVTAIDVSPAMLAAAHRKALADGMTNIRFLPQGFLTYEHEGPLLDAVTTTFALHHLPDYWQFVALRRIHAILRPRGRFLLRDVVIPDGTDPQSAIQNFIDAQAQLGGEFLRQDAEGHFREEFSTFAWVLEGLLKRAGFQILDHQLESHVLATYLCQPEQM
jgi:putative AdoMet-dependent methyltransferase